MTYLQMIYEDLKLVYWLVITHEEIYFYHYQPCSVIILILLLIRFFIADFNLLSCEFDSFAFKLLYCVNLYRYKIKLYFAFNGIVFNEVALIKLLRFLEKNKKQFLLLVQ